MQPKAPIDLAFLAAQTCSDAGLERDLLRLFVEQARKARFGLETADHASISLAVTLHTLRGSALALGAHQVAASVVEAESSIARAPARSSRPEVKRSLRRLALALDEASAFAARLLDEH